MLQKKGINMTSQIEKKISNLPKLTQMQKKVADYIIKHPIDVTFITLDQFSSIINTSTTTIMRLMYQLGYSGYSEFQRELQAQFRDKVNPGVRLETGIKDVGDENIWGKCYEKQIHNIQTTFTMIPEETLDQVVNSIAAAQRKYFLAVRGGLMVAQYMNDFLGRMFGKCQLIHADNFTEWCSIVPDLNESDLIIAISFPRYAKRLARCLQLAKEKRSKITLLTDSYSAPIAKYADLLLPCNYDSLGFHNSPMAAMMLADCIVNVAAIRYSELVQERLNQADKIMIEEKYYLI